MEERGTPSHGRDGQVHDARSTFVRYQHDAHVTTRALHILERLLERRRSRRGPGRLPRVLDAAQQTIGYEVGPDSLQIGIRDGRTDFLPGSGAVHLIEVDARRAYQVIERERCLLSLFEHASPLIGRARAMILVYEKGAHPRELTEELREQIRENKRLSPTLQQVKNAEKFLATVRRRVQRANALLR